MEKSDERLEKKFLVLIDFSKSAYQALKYAISLAKSVEAKLILLYAAKPRDLVNNDNPSVALRAMDIATRKAEAQLKSIVEMIEAEGISVEYHNTVGDVCKKTHLYIDFHKPDLLVLGKATYGERQISQLTDYLLHQFTGNIIIIGSDTIFNKETKIALECNSKTLNKYSSQILFWLNKNTNEPLRVFVNNKNRSANEFMFPVNWRGIAEAPYKVCARNGQRFSLAKSIIKHISTEKIDLICIGRKEANKSFFTKLFNETNTISEVINNARIPTLIMGNAS